MEVAEMGAALCPPQTLRKDERKFPQMQSDGDCKKRNLHPPLHNNRLPS